MLMEVALAEMQLTQKKYWWANACICAYICTCIHARTHMHTYICTFMYKYILYVVVHTCYAYEYLPSFIILQSKVVSAKVTHRHTSYIQTCMRTYMHTCHIRYIEFVYMHVHAETYIHTSVRIYIHDVWYGSYLMNLHHFTESSGVHRRKHTCT